MSEERIDYLNVGKIVNTHGIAGEVRVLPVTDFPDVRFAPGAQLWVDCGDQAKMTSVEVASARTHKNMYLVRFKEYSSINEVEKYKGCQLVVSREERVPLPDEQYYYYEIIGCRVVTEAGAAVGVIQEIMHSGANDVWIAIDEQSGKEILIPVIDGVVLDVDPENKQVVIDIWEGML